MSWKIAALTAACLVLGVAFARLVQDPDTGTATWDAERASGFAGYLLLWASLMTGMLLFLRVRPPGGPLTLLLETHRMLSALALSFVAVHVAAFLLDPFVHFGIRDVTIPLSSGYRPLQVAAGIAASWLAVIVLASTALAGGLGLGRWRQIHYLSFPCWLLALVHGITSGTDTSASLALSIYAVTAGAAAALLAVRVAGRNWASAAEPAPRPFRR
jgi:DMSO/TMAO reductase YedYZ heme-binding membrane subunit